MWLAFASMSLLVMVSAIPIAKPNYHVPAFYSRNTVTVPPNCRPKQVWYNGSCRDAFGWGDDPRRFSDVNRYAMARKSAGIGLEGYGRGAGYGLEGYGRDAGYNNYYSY